MPREQSTDSALPATRDLPARENGESPPTPTPPTRSNLSASDGHPAPQHPEKIGRYRIEKLLGKGGFGSVYLAYDEMLERTVALKVPRPELVGRIDAKIYLAEARILAGLDHPHIVPVHDVGQTDDGGFFIVSKFIEGADLAAKIKEGRPAFAASADLVATVAEALQYAHQHGLVHRDIKPANILIDNAGKPYLADFGLALKDEDFGKRSGMAGTPAFMSPEQANGEGHRVDGRSDIFSLGIVLYLLLTGRLPFRGGTQEMLQHIVTDEIRPPRQWDESIPKEMERICLKAVAKRAADRYSTARDFADDLRCYLDASVPDASASSLALAPVLAPVNPATPVVPEVPSSQEQAIKIVHKGLRSFDAADADFFLELLPGPRDREGLPDSIRFWKGRIEEMDADNTFTVGLIYGPSGCGKSSLVKAGLLPRLSSKIIPVYIEATAQETETRLLNGLRKRCPDLSPNLDLKQSLAALRRGNVIPAGKKVLIVLDQFEQWLHTKLAAASGQGSNDLIQSLRQCDGAHVQCIVMVRDDFWLAATRFLGELEVDLLQGKNAALADLVDVDHAKKVLTALGRAFGRLPEKVRETSKEQKEFLNQAVSSLAQDGKVVCVRLALFAEMMKGKAWTPTALKAVGGVEGVGATFLEETFSAQTANPKHRLHQKAARAVLQALLPEFGTDIKGQMRSHAELLQASGYADRLKDFDDLLRVLDGEIRLITPTDPEGMAEGEPGDEGEPGGVSARSPGVRYYQLTHDYLVPSLRDWLTRKQKETHRGRAELLLTDRAGVWNARPENRQLPSLWQWGSIRGWTRKKNWTGPERKMMRKATRYHLGRAAAATAFAVVLLLVGFEWFGRFKAQTLRDRLRDSPTAAVPGIVKDMTQYRHWINPLLRVDLAAAEDNSREQLNASLALLPVDPAQLDYVYRRLLKAEPHEILAIREGLSNYQEQIREPLWTLLKDQKTDQDERFRAACALASFDADDPRWKKVAPDVAARLIAQNKVHIGAWMEALTPVAKSLLEPLGEFLVDEKRSAGERELIANVFGNYAADSSPGADAARLAIAGLEKKLQDSDPNETVDAKVAQANRQANVGVALVTMRRGEKVWPLLKHTPDPTLRSFLIDRLASGGADPKVLIAEQERLASGAAFAPGADATRLAADFSIPRALLLSLGQFDLGRLSLAERQNLIPKLAEIYKDHPDPGLHAAAELLLRHWDASDKIKEIDKALAQKASRAASAPGAKRQWYINGQGQTMMIIPKPGVIEIGDENEGSKRHQQRIDRSYAIASKEVTVEQFLAFRQKHEYFKQYAPTADCPVNQVDWYGAAAYCNWLSEKEGLAKDQWCYLPNEKGEFAEGMKPAPDYLKRTGYRLPTEAEWEHACRARSLTTWSCGHGEDVLKNYAWYFVNSASRSQPTGQRLPNDFGLFDMHGNAWEWCQDRYQDYPKQAGGKAIEDIEDLQSLKKEESRVLRGGAFTNSAVDARSAVRLRYVPAYRNNYMGFRPARTFTAD